MLNRVISALAVALGTAAMVTAVTVVVAALSCSFWSTGPMCRTLISLETDPSHRPSYAIHTGPPNCLVYADGVRRCSDHFSYTQPDGTTVTVYAGHTVISQPGANPDLRYSLHIGLPNCYRDSITGERVCSVPEDVSQLDTGSPIEPAH